MNMIKPFLLSLTLTPAMLLAASVSVADEHADKTDYAGTKVTFLAEQPSGTLHASELMGADVRSMASDDEKIGSIDNFLLDENGQIIALVVSMGGLMGMGEKVVAIDWDGVVLSHEDDDYVVRINADQDTLEEADDYEHDVN